MPTRPNSKNNLNRAIARLAKDSADGQRMERLMANAIVGALLPDGAVKGGSSLKFRFGIDATRFSTDLDTVHASALEDFIGKLRASLATGWEGFTGDVVRREPATPAGVPAGYVMQPFDVKLSYLGKSWMTVALEVGHNEIGDADEADLVSSPQIDGIFEKLGFPSPGPIPVMKLEHQIAQKLHGASTPGSERAHDLIDLQVIVRNGNPDLGLVKRICERLFAYRRQQAWPPTLEKQPGWDELYRRQAEGLDVLPMADEAVTWANEFIASINGADSRE